MPKRSKGLSPEETAKVKSLLEKAQLKNWNGSTRTSVHMPLAAALAIIAAASSCLFLGFRLPEINLHG